MKLLSLLPLALIFVSQIAAAQFQEGTHYKVLKQPTAAKQEVREYFSFYCPHCFKQEPLMAEIKKDLPNGVKLTKNHVDGMPGRTLTIEQALTKAILVAEKLKIKEQVVADIFNKIHVHRSSFKSVDDVRKLFLTHKISAEQFDKAFNSFSINAMMNKMRKNTDILRKQGITGVPTLIINGKYQPITSSIKNIQEYKALIAYLVNKPV